jgi:hypothetical protein
MSNTIYLYLKTHNKTGLKYLGKTVQDPLNYKGSGKRWNNHIKKHGYDVTTEVLFESVDPIKIKEKGIYYSNLWDIVESNEFANLKVEKGDGGFDHINNNEIANANRIEALKKAKKVCCSEPTPGSFKKNDPRVKEISKKANTAKKEKIKNNPDIYKAVYKKISELQSGTGNSQFSKVWCVKEDATGYNERKKFKADQIPNGWISCTEHRERRKVKTNSAYGRSWYNDGQKNYFLKPNDPKIKERNLEKRRIL